ncbi:MAG: hypothetical protein H8E12_14765 [Rhodobacteraceae bacterium]|nr:hypothetical protein [Paracoccaceae bacterium]
MSSEPTRLMAGSPPFSLKGGVTELTSVKAYYMSPGLNFIKQNNTDEYAAKIAENKGIAQNDYVLSFTPEESYKGVKSEQTHITGLEAAYLQQMAKRPTDES